MFTGVTLISRSVASISESFIGLQKNTSGAGGFCAGIHNRHVNKCRRAAFLIHKLFELSAAPPPRTELYFPEALSSRLDDCCARSFGRGDLLRLDE